MSTPERRRRRSAEPGLALHYQLAACCDEGQVAAMALADDDGRPLALAGHPQACRDVAHRLTAVASRIDEAECTVLGDGQRWDVSMRKVQTPTGAVVVCAVGGSSLARHRQIERTRAGAGRILG